MTVSGKAYPATLYAVGREKVREYAAAVGETNPVHLDLEAARQAGHADVVAPPMFAVVYAGPAVMQGIFDPELGIDFSRLVHGAQELRWGPLGDRGRRDHDGRDGQGCLRAGGASFLCF